MENAFRANWTDFSRNIFSHDAFISTNAIFRTKKIRYTRRFWQVMSILLPITTNQEIWPSYSSEQQQQDRNMRLTFNNNIELDKNRSAFRWERAPHTHTHNNLIFFWQKSRDKPKEREEYHTQNSCNKQKRRHDKEIIFFLLKHWNRKHVDWFMKHQNYCYQGWKWTENKFRGTKRIQTG